MTDFSTALRTAQGTRSFTEFAAELGITTATLWRWSTGKSVPRSDHVLRTLEAHGIPRTTIRR